MIWKIVVILILLAGATVVEIALGLPTAFTTGADIMKLFLSKVLWGGIGAIIILLMFFADE